MRTDVADANIVNLDDDCKVVHTRIIPIPMTSSEMGEHFNSTSRISLNKDREYPLSTHLPIISNSLTLGRRMMLLQLYSAFFTVFR